MSLRQQLPAWSPTSLSALGAGLAAAAGAGRADADWVVNRVAEEYRAESVILTDSGTSALRLAIEASAPPGARAVACPAWGCYDLATAALGAGAAVLCYDLDPATLAPDPASLAAVLARRPTAVVLVHFFGVPVDLERWRDQVERIGATLIEDAAQAFGGSIRGAPLGSSGGLSVLSFGRGKGRTGGGGGALLSIGLGRPTLSDLASRLEPAGRGVGSAIKLAAQWGLGRPAWYGIPAGIPWLRLGETVFHQPWAPRSMAPAIAAALRANWMGSAVEAEARRRSGDRWKRVLDGCPGLQLVETDPAGVAGWLRFPVIGTGLATRLATARARELGVMPGYPVPLFRHPALAGRIDGADRFPGADRLAAGLVTLPTHSLVTDAERSAIEAMLGEAAR